MVGRWFIRLRSILNIFHLSFPVQSKAFSNFHFLRFWFHESLTQLLQSQFLNKESESVAEGRSLGSTHHWPPTARPAPPLTQNLKRITALLTMILMLMAYLIFVIFLHAHILSHENFTLGKSINLQHNCQKQYFSGSSLPSVSCSPLRTSRTPCSLQPNTFPTTFHSDIPVASCQSYHLLGVPWHPYHNGNATPPLKISTPWD